MGIDVRAPRASAMSGGTVIAPNAAVSRTRLARAREVASDLLIATALIWALPLLFGVAAALVTLVLQAF